MPKKWMQRAVHPSRVGAYTKHAKQHGGIAKAIPKDLHSPNPRIRRQAQFAKASRAVAAKHKRQHRH